ncbi:MAG: TraB/GumN family protein [Candidatus Aenigmarchaeota archaeon]|nr:TraB/GumN family protein [Candidatus Aenigmarchaeota archaeon]
MQKAGKVTILGTSHISKESVGNAVHLILEQKPDCVAVELCPERFFSLTHKTKGSFPSPFYFFLHLFQQYLSSKTGVMAGSEMLYAVEAAQAVSAHIEFIDKNISETAMKIKAVSGSEKLRLFTALIFSPLASKSFNLQKTPSKKDVSSAVSYLKENFPQLHSVLIEERDKHMFSRISELRKHYKKIIVIVGAGHEAGLKKLLRRHA